MEGVINGKQYNYATRVLENVYDALSRFKVESFKEWIRERGKANENILERVISSSDFELCKEKLNFELNQTCFSNDFHLRNMYKITICSLYHSYASWLKRHRDRGVNFSCKL